ncbi:type II toxin-antitoxin system toxin DNA ADP-ribosyl transferase DarT [Sinomicrobium sp.]
MEIPKVVRVYRMVHWRNVEFILQHGICSKTHQNADPNYINIGMRSLIDDRHDYKIPIERMGSLGEYIPFYFAGHSPMLYMIMHGLNGVTKRPQEDIVFLVCNYEEIKNASLRFLFTDRNAKMAVANFFRSEQDFCQLAWDCIRTKYWKSDESNLERRDLKQAEFLVYHYVPVHCIQCIVVKNLERKEYFDNMIRSFGLSIPVYIDKSCKLYY